MARGQTSPGVFGVTMGKIVGNLVGFVKHTSRRDTRPQTLKDPCKARWHRDKTLPFCAPTGEGLLLVQRRSGTRPARGGRAGAVATVSDGKQDKSQEGVFDATFQRQITFRIVDGERAR